MTGAWQHRNKVLPDHEFHGACAVRAVEKIPQVTMLQVISTSAVVRQSLVAASLDGTRCMPANRCKPELGTMTYLGMNRCTNVALMHATTALLGAYYHPRYRDCPGQTGIFGRCAGTRVQAAGGSYLVIRRTHFQV